MSACALSDSMSMGWIYSYFVIEGNIFALNTIYSQATSDKVSHTKIMFPLVQRATTKIFFLERCSTVFIQLNWKSITPCLYVYLHGIIPYGTESKALKIDCQLIYIKSELWKTSGAWSFEVGWRGWCASNVDVFLGCAELSMQDQRLQKHSFAPRGTSSDKSSSGQSKPKSKGTALLLRYKPNWCTHSLVWG